MYFRFKFSSRGTAYRGTHILITVISTEIDFVTLQMDPTIKRKKRSLSNLINRPIDHRKR